MSNIPELEKHRREVSRHVIVVEYEAGLWAVLMSNPERDNLHCPLMLYDRLDSPLAAELARQDVVANLSDPCHEHPYGPSEVTPEDFNRIAREGGSA